MPSSAAVAGLMAELTLGPLNEDETHALATQVAQRELDPDLAACIHGETEGNPLFVVELARAGRLVVEREPECPPQGLPPRMQWTIEERLAQRLPTGPSEGCSFHSVGHRSTSRSWELMTRSTGISPTVSSQ